MLEQLRSIFKKNPDRTQYQSEFVISMNLQLSGFWRIAAFIAIFAWLEFAFKTDKLIHPEYEELFFFRIGLTVLAVLIFAFSFVPQLKQHGALYVKILLGYIIVSTSFFTGRLAADPNYVSGLQIGVMIPIAAPVRFRLILIFLLSSIAIFLTSVLIYKPELGTDVARYSMNNLVISYVLAISFTYLLDKIRFDSFLKTKKIELKNIEIEAQIKRINELKTQQDGDYFLTSQLLHPLALNEAIPSNIKVEFLTEQKKKFQFRQWASEIGGDISSSNTVFLREKQYIAFMNGDAMGKSIQGAGGALVLGTVFKSFLHRTQHDEKSHFLFPEQWLRDCYLELHHVMTAFDGRMLVSAVVGLIDEDNGFLYYINAEHPWMAIYRNGTAEFIENEFSLRKLGMPDTEELFRIKSYQLQAGDKLFAGSDGRDDLLFGRDEIGNVIINKDETLFLRIIEKANGNLARISELLKIEGEITDDLSLVSISYEKANRPEPTRADVAEIRKHLASKDVTGAITKLQQLYADNPRDPRLVYELALMYSRTKKFNDAAALGEEYLRYDPSDLGVTYLTSRALKYAAGDDKNLLKRAADYGERLILREPMGFHGIVNLADIYRRLNRKDRAVNLLKKAKAINPEHKAVKKQESLLAKEEPDSKI